MLLLILYHFLATHRKPFHETMNKIAPSLVSASAGANAGCNRHELLVFPQTPQDWFLSKPGTLWPIDWQPLFVPRKRLLPKRGSLIVRNCVSLQTAANNKCRAGPVAPSDLQVPNPSLCNSSPPIRRAHKKLLLLLVDGVRWK